MGPLLVGSLMHFEGHPKITPKENVASGSLCPFPLCMAFGVQEEKSSRVSSSLLPKPRAGIQEPFVMDNQSQSNRHNKISDYMKICHLVGVEAFYLCLY